MIDIDHELMLEPGYPRPGEIAALHHDDRVDRRAFDPAGDLDPVHPGELLVVLRRRVRVDNPDLLAERVQRERHRQLRPDRIAVWPGVGGDEESLPGEDLAADIVDPGRSGGRHLT